MDVARTGATRTPGAIYSDLSSGLSPTQIVATRKDESQGSTGAPYCRVRNKRGCVVVPSQGTRSPTAHYPMSEKPKQRRCPTHSHEISLALGKEVLSLCRERCCMPGAKYSTRCLLAPPRRPNRFRLISPHQCLVLTLSRRYSLLSLNRKTELFLYFRFSCYFLCFKIVEVLWGCGHFLGPLGHIAQGPSVLVRTQPAQ